MLSCFSLIISNKFIIKQMQKDELTVQVVDRRLQVNLDAEQGIQPKNSFMQSQGFQSKDKEAAQYEEEQQQVVDYKIQKLLPKQSQKQRLIEQNIKLKTQIYQLAKQLDEILLKDKSKKKSYGLGLNKIDEEDELIRQKRLEVQRQQIQIADLKNRIFIAKRQLECVYNNDNIQAKEDEIKNLKAELKTLQDQKEGHLNIQKLQSKALKVVRNEQEYGEKIKNVMNQCNRLRKQSKQLIEKITTSEKILMKTHDTYVGKYQTIRDLQQKLALNKEKGKNKKQAQTNVTEQIIQNMENQIKRLEAERKEGEKVWQDKIKSIDIQLLLKRNEEEKKLLSLKQKERELKLNELKIKQLKKMARQMEEGPSQGRKTSQDMDMSQFRHKRNIRYLQK